MFGLFRIWCLGCLGFRIRVVSGGTSVCFGLEVFWISGLRFVESVGLGVAEGLG